MTREEKAIAYDEALEQAKKELNTCGSLDCDAARQIFRFFPELAESEDERIRKVIYQLMLGMREEIFTSQDEIVTKEKVLAYLEKQKEEEGYEAIPVKSTLEYKLGFADGRDFEKQKEQKPVERYLDLTELLVPQRNIGQKPNSEFDPNSVKNKSYSIQIDQWSEDDEHRRKDAIYFLESARGHYADTSEIDKTINFLKSLRPKPKQEWSDEEKDKVAQYLHDRDGGMLWSKATEIAGDILDMLRPSWKPSDWQMSMLLAVINDPNNAGSESCYLTLKSIYEQLKKLM